MKERSDGYFQISLMNVFRQAARQRDGKVQDQILSDDGGKVLSMRSVERREGAGQATLKEHLAQDLANLLGTINLDAVQFLEDFDFVRNSVLNYGMLDLSRLSTEDSRTPKVAKELRAALLANEPRLIEETLVVKLRSFGADSGQRIAFDISAEMAARPVDVPMEFVAEIDTGAGKISMSNLVVR